MEYLFSDELAPALDSLIMKILVIGAANNASLCMLQSLGRAGMVVDLFGQAGAFNKAMYSRHVNQKIYFEPIEGAVGEFIKRLILVVNEGSYDLVIPSNDRFALLLSLDEVRNAIGSTDVAIPPYEILSQVMDKGATLKLAQKVGCPIPATIYTDDAFVKNLDVEVSRLDFPIVLKPRFSWSLRNGELVKGTPTFIHDPSEFMEKFLSVHSRVPYPLIQEQIRGDGWGLELLFWDGKIEVAFSHKRIREANPLGSYSSAVESIPLDSDCLEYAREMLAEIGWNGVCMFEFKNDDADNNVPKLMEINGRFWGSLPVAVKSHADFPRYLAAKYNGGENLYSGSYVVGVKCRWMLADLVHLYKVFRGRPKGWEGYFPSKGKTLLEFLKFYKYRTFLCDPWDVLPGIMELVMEPAAKIKKAIFQ